jgi:hypothetical protein
MYENIYYEILKYSTIPKIKKCLKQNIDNGMLSLNTNAIYILEKKTEIIYWPFLCMNPAAIHLIEKPCFEKDLYWQNLVLNPAAINLIIDEIKKGNEIYWYHLSQNSSSAALELLYKNPDKINWLFLSSNENEDIIKLINKYNAYDKLHLPWINENPVFIKYLEENPNKIFFKFLSSNKQAAHILLKNLDKIDWIELCKNSADCIVNKVLLNKKYESKLEWISLYVNEHPLIIKLLKDNYRLNHPRIYRNKYIFSMKHLFSV